MFSYFVKKKNLSRENYSSFTRESYIFLNYINSKHHLNNKVDAKNVRLFFNSLVINSVSKS
jgi:hypothetical protein